MSASCIRRHTPKFKDASLYTNEEHRSIVAAIKADEKLYQLLPPRPKEQLESKSREERIQGLLMVYRFEDLMEHALRGTLLKPNPVVEQLAQERAVKASLPQPAPTSVAAISNEQAEFNRQRAAEILADPEKLKGLSSSIIYKLKNPVPAEVARGLARYDEMKRSAPPAVTIPEVLPTPDTPFSETPEFMPLYERACRLNDELSACMDRLSRELQRKANRHLEQFELIEEMSEDRIRNLIEVMEKLIEKATAPAATTPVLRPVPGPRQDKNVLSGAEARAVLANRPNQQGAVTGRGDAVTGTSGKSKRHRQASAEKRKKAATAKK